MDKSYIVESNKINDLLNSYKKDIAYIFQFSKNISKDTVRYILTALNRDENHEIMKVFIETAFEKKLPMLPILKIIVKILYVLKHVKKYKYGDYYKIREILDKTLEKIGDNKAYIAQKKYRILFDKFNKENPIDSKISKPETKTGLTDDIRDNINRGYIKFV